MVGRITGLQVATALRYRYRDLRHCAGLGRLRGVRSCLGIYRRIWLMWFSHFAIVLPLPPKKASRQPDSRREDGHSRKLRNDVSLLVGIFTEENAMRPVSEYDVKIDVKKRLTLRGATYGHYHVREYKDGRIVLEPRDLANPFTLSRRTLKVMDSSMANLKKGMVSNPVDLSTSVS